MEDKRRRLGWVAVFAVGLALRLLLTWNDGTLDVDSWKAWAWASATDGPQRIYGSNEPIPASFDGLSRALSGEIVNRKVVYAGVKYYVDYPPLTMYYLTVAGKLYLAFDPGFAHADRPGYRAGPLLNFLVRLPSLLADVGVFLLLFLISRRVVKYSRIQSLKSRIAGFEGYWLNPAIILALVLGYLDATFTLPLLAAVWLLLERRHALAWLLFAVAVLTKLQGVFLLPVLLLVTVAERRWRTPAYLLAATGLAAVLLLPYITEARVLELLAGLSYNGRENFVSGYNANPWWLLSYGYAAADAGLGARTDLLMIDRLTVEWGFSPRIVGLGLYAAYLLPLLVWLWRNLHQRVNILLATTLAFYGYTLLLTQTHENHLYPVIGLLTLAIIHQNNTPSSAIGAGVGGEGKLLAPYIALTAVYFLNMFLLYGLGRGSWLGEDAGGLRMVLGFDLTAPLAVVNLALFGWLNWRVVGKPHGGQ